MIANRLASAERAAIEDFVRDNLAAPPFVPAFSVSKLPPASEWGKASSIGGTHLIFVYDETGGATLAFSDGTNWRRVQDRNVVS